MLKGNLITCILLFHVSMNPKKKKRKKERKKRNDFNVEKSWMLDFSLILSVLMLLPLPFRKETTMEGFSVIWSTRNRKIIPSQGCCNRSRFYIFQVIYASSVIWPVTSVVENILFTFYISRLTSSCLHFIYICSLNSINSNISRCFM